MLAAMSATPLPPDAACTRSGGDACPGTLRLHRADDGALARIRIPGGILTPRQAEVLGEAAGRLGDGGLHLTSRGNVQLRGLAEDAGPELARLLGEAGLLPSGPHERVRNVVASPLAGLDGRGAADIRPWLTGLDRLICASDRATGLSGRFLFALDDGRGDVDALGADITLIALAGERAALRAGASDTVLTVPAGDAPRAALLAAGAFLDAARPTGAWRVKDLSGDVAAALPGEVLRRLRRAGADAVAGSRPRPPGAVPPEPGPVAGSPALCVGVPLGRLDAAQWRLLSGAGELRLTPWRGAVVTEGAPGLLGELAAAGLITGPDSPWAGVGACIGRPGCARSLADVRSLAAAAVGPPGGLPVYWSGCERRCGHPHGEWVDVVATAGGHRVSVVRGERSGTPVAAGDDPAALAAAVAAARGPRTA
ncbi:cobalamin biosynthesis protein CobG [Streptomyces nitrosporeus]|uniref:Cobalamin biosynthesis protein CobG n=1 Tax=Streptomyces nitrosporeus TaxID=28894 RepID=A0A5J6FEI5_9ACTN|nr:nitrite/sulfite reductase [Streptomyces nitrosporeus]QEU73355.1 cobalamin biosynthesis protein CobG [Streptomyces nitrosporeus]GGZ17123.1 precorrin-3B synthase [Streptomyces nitrosporeus]